MTQLRHCTVYRFDRQICQYLSTCLPWLGTSWRDSYHLCISNTEWLVVLPYQKLHEEGSCRGSFQKSLPFCPTKLWIPDTEVRFPRIPISCMHAKSLQLCPALCDPMDCSPLGSSVHGILQPEWVAVSSSADLSDPAIESVSPVSCIGSWVLYD